MNNSFRTPNKIISLFLLNIKSSILVYLLLNSLEINQSHSDFISIKNYTRVNNNKYNTENAKNFKLFFQSLTIFFSY